jgi:hypothetical protein
MRSTLYLASLLIGARATAEPSLQFVGVMASHAKQSVVVYDAEAKQMSPWLDVGQAWDSYVIKSFDPTNVKLTVIRKGKPEVLSLRDSSTRPPTTVRILKGTFETENGIMVYSADTQIRIGGKIISSPTGVMVSDVDQKMVVGDFVMERPDGSMVQFTNATLHVNGDCTDVTAESMSHISPPVADVSSR